MQDWFHNIDFFIAMRSDVLTPVIKIISVFGDSSFFLLFLSLGYWIFNKNLFARLGLWLILSILLMAYLKDLFKDPRPDVILQLDTRVKDSYGFPSGHAQLAVVFWFWIAVEVRKSWVWILSSILVIGICFSRLYLGVHDLEDVIGGAAIGLLSILIFVFITSIRFVSCQKNKFIWQILTIITIEVIFFIIWPGKIPDIVQWFAYFLLGFWSGVHIEREYFAFLKHHDWRKILASGVIGIIIFFLFLYIRLEFWITMESLDNAKIAVLFTHAFVNGLYVTALAPWIFQKLNLASK